MAFDKQSDASLEAMREQMHRQMLSSVSHDLKTPLATMIGSLEIYQRMYEKLSPEKRDALVHSALSEAYRLDQFITNILDMAKLESGMVKTKAENCDMQTLLQDCVTRLGPRAAQHHITITGTSTKTPPRTDVALFSRAVGLVIDNATKHAGRPATVNIQYECDGKEIKVVICDHGPGIPEGKEQEIFSKYTRLMRHDQQNAGTGLGLCICRQIMMLLGGTVEAGNRKEGGACFTLSSPYLS